MKEQSYKADINRWVYDLMHAALELSSILDTYIEKGMVKVDYLTTAQLIKNAQISARIVADELSFIASGDADLSELYPHLYAQEKGGEL